MNQIEMNIDRILRYLIDHVYSKDEAIKQIIPFLMQDKEIDPSFKWDRSYQREFLLFQERIEKHIDLMLEFRRNRDDTIKYFLKTAEEAEEEIKNVKRYYELLDKAKEANSVES